MLEYEMDGGSTDGMVVAMQSSTQTTNTITTQTKPRTTQDYIPRRVWYLDLPKRYIVAVLTSLALLLTTTVTKTAIVNVATMADDNSPGMTSNDWLDVTYGCVTWGTILAAIPGGILATIYPPHIIVFISVAIMTVANLLIHLIYLTNNSIVVGICLLFGVTKGLALPACYGLIARWSPSQDRTHMTAIMMMGPLCSYMILHSLHNNKVMPWNGPFYIYGSSGIVWCILWIWLVKSNPHNHSTISQAEVNRIKNTWTVDPPATFENTTKLPIYKSGPLWSLVLCSFTASCCFVLLVFTINMFMKIMHYTAGTTIVTILPFIVPFVAIVPSCLFLDWLSTSTFLSATAAKKSFICSFIFLEALMFIGLCLPKNVVTTIQLITFASLCNKVSEAGFVANVMELGPKYAGMLMGVMEVFQEIAAVICRTSFMMHHYDTRGAVEWNLFYITSIVLLILSMISYAVFCSTERQQWANYPKISEEQMLVDSPDGSISKVQCDNDDDESDQILDPVIDATIN